MATRSQRTLIIRDDLSKLMLKIKKKTGARKLLEGAATDYLTFVHGRHLGNPFRALKPATIARRNRRKSEEAKAKTNLPLRDTEQLLQATRPEGGRGQIKRLDVRRMGIKVGIGSEVYFDPTNRDRAKSRTLAQLHNFNAATGRPILVAPNIETRNKIEGRVSEWIQTLLP